MRSITTILPAPGMNDSFSPHDPFANLDPALQHPSHSQSQFYSPQTDFSATTLAVSSPVMDLQYILSPSILEDQQQQQQQQQPSQPPVHPPLVFQEKHQLVPPRSSPDPEPVPSSSRAPPPTQHVHPNPDDAIISFDSKTRSFPKPSKPSTPAVTDPYAEHFLRDMLGPEKWETFSTRLFERRLGGKGKGKAKQGEEEDPKAGASAVEFLVKVEVVKSILRECVPHPYNPRKSLSHPYAPAPSGNVTLTRSTVLLLCGWSNTQFSYWARRSEAVSVLAEYDPRLRAVGAALERRLRGDPPPSPDDEDEGASVTGKGLDTIIEDVKKRTGKSQFLRGKHSSLDPFGTSPQDPAAPPPPPQYAMPTFQAERYDHGTTRVLEHEGARSMGPLPPPVSPPAPPKRRLPHLQAPPPRPAVTGSREASASFSSVAPSASPTSASTSSSQQSSPRTTRAATRKAAVAAADDNAHHFPVSDSRSEVEKPASGKRKADDDSVDEAPNKRPRMGKERL